MLVDRVRDLVVEGERRRGPSRVEVRDLAGFRRPYEGSVAAVEARIDRQELIERGQRANELAEVEPDRADALVQAVGQGADRLHRPAVRRAERDERPRLAPAL